MTDPKRLKPSSLVPALVLASAVFAGEVKAGTTTSTASLAPTEARLFDATSAVAAGDFDRAERLLAQSATPLDDYRALIRARALVGLGKKEKAYAELETIKPRALKCSSGSSQAGAQGAQAAQAGAGAKFFPHPLHLDAVVLKAELLAATEPSAAAEMLLAVPEASADLLAQAADLYRRAGDTGQAETVEARLLIEMPESPEARGLAKSLRAAGIKERLPSPEQRLARVRALLDSHQNLDARVEAMRLVEELGAKSDLRCELLFIAGKADRKLRQYASAITTLVSAREQCLADEDTELVLRAALLEVQVRSIRGQLAAAKKLALWISTTHPTHTFGDDALLHVANLAADAGKEADAKKLYLKIIDDIPNNDQGGEAAWRLAYAAIKAGDVAEATKRLDYVLSRGDVTPIERGRARFWLAMTMLPKEEAKAKALFEEVVLEPTFYSWLALDRLDVLKPAWSKDLRARLIAVRDASASVAAASSSPAITTAPELDRARRLYAIGAPAYAEAELELLVPCVKNEDDALALALAFDAIEVHARAQQLLRGRPSMFAGPMRAETLAIWRAAYSRPYWDLIEKASKESKVPPLFLLALSREESTFDPEIVSWAGATGLAQLMPGTAIVAHLSLGLGRLDPERLTEPELNLRLGARVLRDAMKDFGEREPLALVAYNGGPGVAKKLAEVSPPKPFERWVEEISIKETRGYVKRVMETYGVYRFLYDKERPFLAFPASIGQ